MKIGVLALQGDFDGGWLLPNQHPKSEGTPAQATLGRGFCHPLDRALLRWPGCS